MTADPAASAPAPRGGRNVPAALGVGLFLGVGCVLLPIYLYPPLFVVIVAAAVVIALGEMGTLVRAAGAHPPMAAVVLGGVAVIAGVAWQGITGLAVGLGLALVAVIGARVVGPTDGFLRDAAAGALSVFYVAGGAGFGLLLALDDDQGADRLVAVLATAVAVDVGGYLAGVSFGRHPMAPRVSPKKTWEGLAGSLLAAVAVAAGVFVFLLDAPWWQGALFGLLLCPVAVVGDLAESAMKRDAGVKDSGTLLPGHGGLLDRLDSLLLSAPVGWLLLTWLI